MVENEKTNTDKSQTKPSTSFGFQNTSIGFKKPSLPKFGGFGLKNVQKSQLVNNSAFGNDSDSDDDETPNKKIR